MRISHLSGLLGIWPRRLLALGCLLLAGISALDATHAGRAAPQLTDVLISSHNLAAGAVITIGDVRIARWPAQLRPTTALRTNADVVGRRLAGPLAIGDVLTAERLVGADLTANLAPGLIAAPVTLVDAGSVSLIRAGDVVDLLSAAGEDESVSPAQMVAQGVLVLAVVPPAEVSDSATAQLVVAVDRATELRIAQTASRSLLATVVNHP